jgi:hypothetical protein
MKRFGLVILLFCLINLNGHIYLNNCADRLGVANISLLSQSPITSYYNPAISHEGISSSISQPYGFKDVDKGNLSISKDFQKYNITITSNYLISPHYTYFSNNLAMNYKFDNYAILGIGYKIVSIREEENYNLPETNIGLLLHKDNVRLAVSYSNLLNKKSSRIELPNILTSEISFKLNQFIGLALGLEKEKNYKQTTKIAIRYKALKSLELLSGYSLDPNQLFAGMQVDYKKIKTVYALESHLELGLTHTISLIYAF